MNEYNANELEEFEHPYELEYSSLKSSKNESLKLQNKEYNNRNLFRINNNNKNIYQNNQNIIINQNNDNIISDFNIMNNNNFRLNEANKKNIEKIIGMN